MTFKARCAHILVPLTVVLLIVGLIRLTLGFAPVVFVIAAVTWSTISDGLVQGITTAAVATGAVDDLFVAPFLSVRLDAQFVWLGFNYILAAWFAEAIRPLILRKLGMPCSRVKRVVSVSMANDKERHMSNPDNRDADLTRGG